MCGNDTGAGSREGGVIAQTDEFDIDIRTYAGGEVKSVLYTRKKEM